MGCRITKILAFILKTRQSTATNQQIVQPHGQLNWPWVVGHVVALLPFCVLGSGGGLNTVLDLGLYFRKGEISILMLSQYIPPVPEGVAKL